MKRYEKYKKSGIDWLKEIPEHWELKKLKYEVSLKNDKVLSQDSMLTYIGMENIESGTGRYIATDSEVEGLANYFTKGDILFGKLRPYLAKVFLTQTEGICSTEFLVFRCNESNSNHFFHKLLLSPNFIEVVNSSTYGAKMPRANSEYINNLKVPVPSLSEQTAIAAFLDHKTAQIDALIEKKEQLIEKLKLQRQAIINEAVTKGLNPDGPMKDSDIEWLGEIPAHWEVSYIKRGVELLTDYEANGSFDSIKNNVVFTDDTGYAWYVRATDLENNFISDENLVRWVDEGSYNFLEKTKLYGGELLVAKRGEIGKVYLMPEVSVKATLAPNLYLVRLNDKLDSQFVWYFFESELGKSQLKLKNRSTTMGALYKDDFKEIPFVFPPIEEQIEIKNKLNTIAEKYNHVVDSVLLSIDKLKLYRQSLISEAVTGKIDVRDWENPEK